MNCPKCNPNVKAKLVGVVVRDCKKCGKQFVTKSKKKKCKKCRK